MERFLVTVVAAGLIKNPRGEILLITKNSHWTIPTGHIKIQDKDVEEGLVREMKEELGLEKISIIESLGGIVRNKESPSPKIIEVFSCNITSDEAIKIKYKEGKEIWIRPSEAVDLHLDELAVEAIRRYLDKYPPRKLLVQKERKGDKYEKITS